jgi:hypothetical protein
VDNARKNYDRNCNSIINNTTKVALACLACFVASVAFFCASLPLPALGLLAASILFAAKSIKCKKEQYYYQQWYMAVDAFESQDWNASAKAIENIFVFYPIFKDLNKRVCYTAPENGMVDRPDAVYKVMIRALYTNLAIQSVFSTKPVKSEAMDYIAKANSVSADWKEASHLRITEVLYKKFETTDFGDSFALQKLRSSFQELRDHVSNDRQLQCFVKLVCPSQEM